MANGRKPRYTLEIEAPDNGRMRKADVALIDGQGKTVASDKGDLQSAKERKRVAGVLAASVDGVDAGEILKLIDAKQHEMRDQHKRLAEQLKAGSPEAAGVSSFELLDAAPLALRRPLALVEGRGYAAAWVPGRNVVRQATDPKTGAVQKYDPPLVTTCDVLLIVRDDGQVYTDAALSGARPLAELGLLVRLPAPLPPGREWSGVGVKRFLAGQRPGPAEVFGRVRSVVDTFVDFSRSLASQERMCELVGCYVLGTYFLDAFHVVGYLWPNGDKGTGKTQFLNVITEMGYLGQVILAGSSYACLRDLADCGATLAFDDAEAVMDVKRSDPDKRTLLLAGNRRGATIAVKELEADGKRWVTRHVNTFCPRLFSAIRLPDEVLGSRSIVVPLVRSGDERRAKSNPLDPQAWPCERRRLIDDLWALGLAHLPELAGHDRTGAASASLAGRNLDPWRSILAVAHWLQESHGVDGLFERLQKLSVTYQGERGEFEAADRARVLFRALLALTHGREHDEACEFRPVDVCDAMKAIAEAEDLADADKAFTTPQRVGFLLARQRFKLSAAHADRKGKLWVTTRREVEQAAAAYGVEVPGAGCDDVKNPF